MGDPPGAFRFSTVERQPTTWLWRPYLAASRLTLLVGHPERGKSLLACTWAAHLTTGRPWPDGQPCPLGDVLFLEIEDVLAETVVGRLDAAGADRTRLIGLPGHELPIVLRAIEQIRPLAVFLSPLNTFLPKVNTWVDKNVRDALQPLVTCAEATGAAIIGLMHPPKGKRDIALHAIVGSIAYSAVPRGMLHVERGEDGLHLIERTKGSLTPQDAPPLAFRIVSWSQDPDIGLIQWQTAPIGVSHLDSSTEDRSALQEACEFLRALTSQGPIAAVTVRKQAELEGHAWHTVRRAKAVLGIKPFRQGGLGALGLWLWPPPPTSPEPPVTAS